MERRPTPYDDLSREQLIELVVERDATIAALNLFGSPSPPLAA
jgi:hypothetical protein